jgi:hypothetical protein
MNKMKVHIQFQNHEDDLETQHIFLGQGFANGRDLTQEEMKKLDKAMKKAIAKVVGTLEEMGFEQGMPQKPTYQITTAQLRPPRRKRG